MSHNTNINSNQRRKYTPETSTTIDPPPISTVQNISNHFSKLYLNHKHPSTNSSSLTKSKSHHYYYNNNKPIKQHQDDEDDDNIKQIVVTTKNQDEDVNSLCSIGMSKGRRRSFGSSSQPDFTHFFASNGVKVVSADMPPFMQIHLVDLTRKTYDSLEKFTAKTLASTLKKEFDGVYGPAWHCIVGSSFGSFVTHSVGGFMYFSMDQKLYVLLFKTAVERAH